MKLPAAIFREYDIRGTVGDQLTPEVARAIGQAFVTLWGGKTWHERPRVAIGRDNRPSGKSLADAVIDGIVTAGGTVIDVGELPTPALYFATHTLRVDGGIQVTGSHNPPEFNGIKMVLGAEPVYGSGIQRLREHIESGRLFAIPGGTRESDESILPRYREAVVRRNGPLPRPVKVVVDCGNGVSSLVAADTLRQLGAEVVSLFCESDGTFPNHHPDPTVLENLRDLRAAVVREQAELGIAFDGDGDRIGAVDEQGRVVFGDQLLVLLARDLARRMGPGHAVIFDVKCSEVLPKELVRAGLRPTMWKTGHSLIKQKMKELGAPLAGEMSGHMFFGGDWYGFDDALFAAARLLRYVAERGGPLSRLLADLPQTVSTPELRVDCPDDRKFDVVARAAKHFAARYPVSTLDGVRITFADGWGLFLLAAIGWATGNLLFVYRAIGSVQLPRRLGDLEIVEAVPQRLLLAGTIATGLVCGFLLALGTGDWWMAAAMASRAPRFGVTDPVLQRDLGYYVAQLPWAERLRSFALTATVSATVIVALLYLGIGSLRFRRWLPYASAHARAHLAVLLASVGLTLTWGALLDPAQTVAGLHGALTRGAVTVRLPVAPFITTLAVAATVASLYWGVR